jgi:hypothetical protein
MGAGPRESRPQGEWGKKAFEPKERRVEFLFSYFFSFISKPFLNRF